MGKFTFEQFNEEINEFYKYCKDNKYNNNEIYDIFKILQEKPKKRFNTKIFGIIAIIIVLLWILTYSERFTWNISAICRIILIKILPVWNWPVLKNEKCLIYKSQQQQQIDINFDCNMCENVKSIDFYPTIDEDTLKHRYLDVDIPLIITIPKTWPKSEHFLNDLAEIPEYSDSIPCFLSTNTQKNTNQQIGQIFQRIKLFDKFFLHYQNCQFDAMKQFRVFTNRPKQFPIDLSPIQYNWLVWNKDYNITNYKRIELIEKYTFWGQITGRMFIKLIPRKNCRDICDDINIVLEENEGLVFTSLWDLEYRPSTGNNVAAILELH